MTVRYITTTLPYVNADPHIGFALEVVQADALARAWRLQGHDVFFNTGTDEHGQKIYEAAQKAGQNVREYVDYYAGEFRKLKSALDLSNDTFIRTTDEHHVTAAQEMWRRCLAAGDIYKKHYEGLYCVGCERFLTEKDITNGKCPIHGTEPVLLKEENYFFRFSRYQERLLEYLAREGVIIPEWRATEARDFVKGGLEDFSVSREKGRLSWGIPVPGDDSQVMYVWFDALTNYISTLGWPEDTEGRFKKFWVDGTTVQTAGKDQIRFQSLMWQAMLMSADVKNTDRVFYHGFINSGGQKMSKSLGNVMSPYALVERYGTDATRYLLLRHVHPFEDSDVTWEKLDEWYNAGLANGLGNLVSRVMKMGEEYGVSYKEYLHLDEELDENFHFSYGKDMPFSETFKFNEIMNDIWGTISALDHSIQRTRPFERIKIDPVGAKKDVAELQSQLARIASRLEPFMPTTSQTIKNAVKANKKPENLFGRKE